ncbi:hypothetical protein DCO56_09410 [Sphingobacterium athyrii]|uniref:Uncharacterized protein n=1 Tax=Sphingobacterium athyrii TaxID=2152717 RepID=A0A363NWF3_9SPHI|nr:hypothetical protein DCO56_09410 [Sphingobacterium athyrii]
MHAIKCCEAQNRREAYISFFRVADLKHEIFSGISDEILNIKISVWRNEYPKVTDELFWYYENLVKCDKIQKTYCYAAIFLIYT